MDRGSWHCTGGSDQDHPKKKKCKKTKRLSEEAFQIAEKGREANGQGKKERYTNLNAEFQRTERRDKKAKTFDCMDHKKTVENSSRDWNTNHLTSLLRNLYAGQEAIVRTGHGTTDWFQIGKGVHQSCILSLCSFNLYAEYIMKNAGLDEAQAGIKIAGKYR